jgi:hypothetical protein
MLPDGILSLQKSLFWRDLQYKMLIFFAFDIPMYCHLVHFSPFGTVCGQLVYIQYVVLRKIWQPRQGDQK